jgi:hypothetical protein
MNINQYVVKRSVSVENGFIVFFPTLAEKVSCYNRSEGEMYFGVYILFPQVLC